MTLEQDMVKFVRSPRFPQTIIERSIPQNRIIIESVASIPREPLDGDEIFYLADATNGVTWRFRYRAGSSSTYKWEFIGGSQLRSVVETSESTSSGAYTDLATVGPSVTVPFAGDYDVYTSCELSGTNAAGLMSYSIGSTAAVDADMIISSISNEAQTMSVSRVKRQSGLTASTALVSKYRTSGVAVSFLRRVIGVTPVRIGG